MVMHDVGVISQVQVLSTACNVKCCGSRAVLALVVTGQLMYC